MMLLLFGYTFSLYMTHLSLIGSNNLILEITTGRNESREKETHLYSIALALNCGLFFFLLLSICNEKPSLVYYISARVLVQE